jgi:hypothetical protein
LRLPPHPGALNGQLGGLSQFLDSIHSGICPLQQRIRVVTILRVNGDTNATSKQKLLPSNGKGLRENAFDLLQHGGHIPYTRDVGKDYNELIAAVTSD